MTAQCADDESALTASICGIWAEALDVAQVGADADFFDLGGHSLLATRILSRVESAYRVRVPLTAFYGDPTVNGLVHSIRTAGTAASTVANPTMRSTEDVFLDELLDELELLDDDEVAAALAGSAEPDGTDGPPRYE